MSPGVHRRRSNRRGTLLAAAVAVLVVLVFAAAMHLRLGQQASDDPEPGMLPESTVEPLDAASPAGTTLPGREMVLPGSVVTWSSTCGVELPVSARYGPRNHDGDRWYGFARQPAGAVIAALHLVVQVSPQTGPDVFLPTLAEQVTGPDADTFTHEVHAGYEQAAHLAQVPYGQPLCPIYGRFVGFLLDSHTPEASSLRLLVEAPGPDGVPRLLSVLVQLTWLDGDWRLVAPPRGDWSSVSTLLPASTADQYTPLTAKG